MLGLTIGAVIGVLLTGWMPALPPLAWPLLALAGAIVSAWRWPRSPSFLILGLCAGVLYGGVWGATLLAARLPPVLEGQTVAVEGRVLGPPQRRWLSRGGWRQSFAFQVGRLDCPEGREGCWPRPGKLLLSYYGDADMAAGQRWTLRVKLRKPWGLANPGSFNYQSWLARHRFSGTGYVREKGMELLSGPPPGWRPDQQWRQAIDRVLRGHFDGDEALGVLLALSNGDRSAMPSQQWARFQAHGLNHLVVISGLHVGMVAGLGFLLGGLFSRRSAHLWAVALALLYSAQAGFAMPTVRALVMLAAVQAVALGSRTLSPWRSLLLAALVIALLDPLAAHNAGFWLSFGAVAVIFYLYLHHPGLRGWRFLLVMQVTLSLLLGGLAGFWFGGFGLLSPLANILAVPLLTFWIAPLCLVASLAAVPAEGLARLCWELAAVPVRGFLALDAQLLEFGLDTWWQWQPSVLGLVSMFAAAALLLSHRAFPFRWMFALALMPLLLPRSLAPAPGELELTVLDVGQGLSIVARSREAAVVYDTGAGDPAGPNMATSVLLPYLRTRGVREVDLLVVSHGDNDHAAGVDSLLQSIPVAETWRGGLAAGFRRGDRPCRRGLAFVKGDLRLTALSPEEPGQFGQSNNLSCVVLLEQGGFKALLPGDIESDMERALVLGKRGQLGAQLLVSPHHGSRTSSSGPFLRQVRPGLVVISRGYANRFSHPHPIVLRRYEALGTEVFDTAQHGAVTTSIQNGHIIAVKGWREQRRFYWH